MFKRVFFENPRRINVRVHSHDHKANVEKRNESKVLNEAHYNNVDIFNGSPIG